MSQSAKTVKKHPPRQLYELICATSHIELAQDRLDKMQRDFMLSILEGRNSTGNPAVDFGVVASDGVYDEILVNKPYRLLRQLPFKHAKKKVLVVQQSTYREDNDIYFLRTIYLAQLRAAPMEFNLKTLCMGIPVEPSHLVFCELIQNDSPASVWISSSNTLIKVGPLRNEYRDMEESVAGENGIIQTPQDAVCDILPHSWDKEHLRLEYGIDESLLDHLMREWIYEQNR